jgi:hypothetical protein
VRLAKRAVKAGWERIAPGVELGPMTGEGFIEPAAGRYMIDYGLYAEIYTGGESFSGLPGSPLQARDQDRAPERPGDVLWLLRLLPGTTEARPVDDEMLRGTVAPAELQDTRLSGGWLLPLELGNSVIVSRGVSHQSLREGEDPLRHAQGQRQAAAASTEVRFIQPHRVVRLEPHIDQLRSLQHSPAITVACQRDGSLFRMGPAAVVVASFPELAVAVVFPGKRHSVGSPGQETPVLH